MNSYMHCLSCLAVGGSQYNSESALWKIDDICKELDQIRDHSFITFAGFSEKLAFLTPWYAHVRVRIRG